MDEEELLEELMDTSFDKAVNISADKIARRIRQDLREEDLIGQSQEWMVKALLRHVLSKILRELKLKLKGELNRASGEIKRETIAEVRNLIQKKSLQTSPPSTSSSISKKQPSTSSQEDSEQISELQEDLDTYKKKVLRLSNQLDRIFNTLLKVYPELQALPIISRTGRMKIVKLCRTMNKTKQEIMPFLKKMEKQGIVRIEGDRVRSLKPLFKQG